MRSKIALGTVQFGLNYGVTNQDGQVTINEAKNILKFAKINKIDILDTASGYGNSEKVLGEIGINDYKVITKTTSLEGGVNNVIDGFYESLKNLNQRKVEGLLIHDISDIESKQFDTLFSKLNELKREGIIKKIGFSTYTPEQVDFILENFDFDLIQVPLNVFDTRLIKGGQLEALKRKGVEVHARSIFLQGVLLDFEKLPDYFSTWTDQFHNYQEIVKSRGLTLLEYALNFALDIQEIDRIVVGVNSEKQLREIIKIIRMGSDLDAYSIDDINLLNPSMWSGK
jgi:aryl-alcohol dehydrogenase-like predicted oxidoreductase